MPLVGKCKFRTSPKKESGFIFNSPTNLSTYLYIIATLITNNLDIYSQFLRTRASRFTIKALLHLNEVILEPDAASIMNGTIRVIRNMLDGTKKFVRFYR